MEWVAENTVFSKRMENIITKGKLDNQNQKSPTTQSFIKEIDDTFENQKEKLNQFFNFLDNDK